MSVCIPPSITVNRAQLCYHGELLFDQLSLVLPNSQWTCLLGPSGVGKTSLLRLIAGLPVGASVEADIKTSDGLNLVNRISYMAQTDLLLPWLNVLENILIGVRLQNRSVDKASKEHALELLNSVGLSQAINKKPHELSGGMRQRVALARTLFDDRPVVLMDEPFAAVDTITRWRLQELAANLLKNKTVLLITHDPIEALRLGHRVHVLSGKPAKLDEPLLLTGTPPRKLTDPDLLHWQEQVLKKLTQAQA